MSEDGARKPKSRDGRNIDAALGTLSGEGSLQRVDTFLHERPREDILRTQTSHAPEPGASTTYYGQPALKPHVWSWTIPAYFYVGGLAGATSVLTAAVRLLGKRRFPVFMKRSRWMALGGDAISGVLLIYDLGRPARFLNMLRVFRPTSPMSVGTYVLSGSGALNTLGFLFAGQRGLLGKLGSLGEYGSGLLGLPLSGYTGVLLANTAVPVWQGGHRTLPVLFTAAAAASAGNFFQLFDAPAREHRLLGRFALAAQLATLAAGVAFEREVARSPAAVEPLQQGASGSLWRTGQLLTAASVLLSIAPGAKPWRRRTAAALGTLGGLAMRFAVVHAGRVSALNPRATFEGQRDGRGAAEVLGSSGVTGVHERAATGFKLPVVP